ncbi:MAG: hypothetical protein NTW03_02125 [Verrucomicrobia bacterium]|nr:hypothetical protein [Verrucomicrobiota bacterium]
MKMIKLLSVVVCASFLMAGATWAADEAKKCCEPAKDIAAQKDCACKCCKKAAEKGVWCKKCHKQAAK